MLYLATGQRMVILRVFVHPPSATSDLKDSLALTLNHEQQSVTHINPDCLSRENVLALDLELQLRRHQSQHVLATLEQSAAGGIVDGGLENEPSVFAPVLSFSPPYLSLVEALERILLALRSLVVRLEEIGPDELQVSESAMIEINLDRLEGDQQDQSHEGEDERGNACDVKV